MDIYHAQKVGPGKTWQTKKHAATMNWLNYGWKWNCCKIFCPKLEKSEAEISRHWIVSWKIQHWCHVSFLWDFPQRLLCLAEPADKRSQKSMVNGLNHELSAVLQTDLPLSSGTPFDFAASREKSQFKSHFAHHAKVRSAFTVTSAWTICALQTGCT